MLACSMAFLQHGFWSNRVSAGAAMTMDSACSTGLLTVHMRCRSLHEGESDLALPFDRGADGFVRSEGC